MATYRQVCAFTVSPRSTKVSVAVSFAELVDRQVAPDVAGREGFGLRFCSGSCHDVPHPPKGTFPRFPPGYHHDSGTPAHPNVAAVASKSGATSAPTATAGARLPDPRTYAGIHGMAGGSPNRSCNCHPACGTRARGLRRRTLPGARFLAVGQITVTHDKVSNELAPVEELKKVLNPSGWESDPACSLW
jgi:hypothetical protein